MYNLQLYNTMTLAASSSSRIEVVWRHPSGAFWGRVVSIVPHSKFLDHFECVNSLVHELWIFTDFSVWTHFREWLSDWVTEWSLKLWRNRRRLWLTGEQATFSDSDLMQQSEISHGSDLSESLFKEKVQSIGSAPGWMKAICLSHHRSLSAISTLPLSAFDIF